MKGYERLAEVLGAEDLLNYIRDVEKKIMEAIENDKVIEIDPDFERKVRDRLREIIEVKFNENSLNVLKSLAVLDLPIDAEVAREIYDLSALNDFIDLGLIEKRNGYLIVDETLKDLVREDVEDYHRKALEYYSNFEDTLDVMTEKAYHHLMLKEFDRAFDYFMKTANQIYGRHRCVEKLIFIREKLMRNLSNELPYDLTVEIEKFDLDGKMYRIAAIIFVEKPSQKSIVIGAGSSGPSTRWGESNFINLIKNLNENENLFFYILCGPNENEISKTIRLGLKGDW